MSRTFAIARLAFREGIRMRVVLVAIVVLIFLVLRLPFALRGDDTLAGRLQNFLAYSLTALSVFLSLAAIFLSCATLTNEIRSCSIHTVVTKPISRFQIVAGKWLGVNLLNVLLVVLCGTAIYGFARFIAGRPEQFGRDRLKVRDVVWTARVAATPTLPDFTELAEAYVQQRVKAGELLPERRGEAVEQRVKELESEWRRIPSGLSRAYRFDDLTPPEREDALAQVRYRLRAIPMPPDEMSRAGWLFVDPGTGRWQMREPKVTEGRLGDAHEFLVWAGRVVDENGSAVLVVSNLTPGPPGRRSYLYFDGDDALQLLYQVGSFEANLVKALLLIVFRVAFISAVGVFFSTFVSFPVACFCTLTVFVVCLCSPYILEAIGANLELRTDEIDPYGRWGPYVRAILVPLLKGLFPDFVRYSAAGHLVDGEYITYGLVARAFVHTVVFGCVLVLGIGWVVFRAREIAAVTV
jgi:hypothetical protein